MLDAGLIKNLNRADAVFKDTDPQDFRCPPYDAATHYLALTDQRYFEALLVLRHYVREVSDWYFGQVQGATNIDLFMLTPSISSPMGPGSDSEPIPIQFGTHPSNLVDSSQFGFEPLLMNGFDKVYCYLPSMRGEDPDKRHLNQFYHCEAEINGTLSDLTPIIEGYVKALCEVFVNLPNIVDRISLNPAATRTYCQAVCDSEKLPTISFDEAVKILEDNDRSHLVARHPSGLDISSQGEIELLRLMDAQGPVWMTHFYRDRVPFYQKPSSDNRDKTINADLLFPPINGNSFGGEIVGSGQRQDTVTELYDSLKRQKVSPEPYEWYINLRRLERYQTTSGFGLGVERFITWALGRDDIKEAIVYPRLKNVLTYP